MAVGNIGPYLSYREDELSTYLSTDAGLTWLQVHKGICLYRWDPPAEIIVMTEYLLLTNKLMFSLDSGKTWKDTVFAGTPIFVTAIHLLSQEKKFAIHGRSHYNIAKESKGWIFYISFRQLQIRECLGQDKPDAQGSDFQKFYPAVASGDYCNPRFNRLLGKERICFEEETRI